MQESLDQALPGRIVRGEKQSLGQLDSGDIEHILDRLLPIGERVDAAPREQRRPPGTETHAEGANVASGLEQQVAGELTGHKNPWLRFPAQRCARTLDKPAPGIADLDDPLDAAIGQDALDASGLGGAFERPEALDMPTQQRLGVARGVLQAPLSYGLSPTAGRRRSRLLDAYQPKPNEMWTLGRGA